MNKKDITETTSSGSVASVAMPLGNTQKRTGSLFKGKKTKKKFYEGKMKDLDFDIKHMSDRQFRQIYGYPKSHFTKRLGNPPVSKPAKTKPPVSEAELSEQDLILLPGQIQRKDRSFVPHDKDRRDHEVEMARNDLKALMKDAQNIYKLLQNRTEDQGLMGWQQKYITLASDYLNSVSNSIATSEGIIDTAKDKVSNTLGKVRDTVANSPDWVGPAVGAAIGGAVSRTSKGVMTGAQLGGEIQSAAKKLVTKEGVIAGGMSNFEEGMAEGKEDLSQYSTEKLKAYLEKHSGGGVPTFGKGALLKRIRAELKRRQQGVAEGDYPDGSSIKTPDANEWKQQYQQAVMAVKNAKTQQEYEAASNRASSIRDLLASKGIQVGPVLGAEGMMEGERKLGTVWQLKNGFWAAKSKGNKIRKFLNKADAEKHAASDMTGDNEPRAEKRDFGIPAKIQHILDDMLLLRNQAKTANDRGKFTELEKIKNKLEELENTVLASPNGQEIMDYFFTNLGKQNISEKKDACHNKVKRVKENRWRNRLWRPYWSPSNQERKDQSAIDSETRSARRREQSAGLEDEDEDENNIQQRSNTFIYYIRIDGKILKNKSGELFKFNSTAAANKAINTMKSKPWNKGKTFTVTQNPNDENNIPQRSNSFIYYIRIDGKILKNKSGELFKFNSIAAANKAINTMKSKFWNKGKTFTVTQNPNDDTGTIKESGNQDHQKERMVSEALMNEKKDACYNKVKSRYKVWPSAYASGALVKCRKVGASNWGKKTTKEGRTGVANTDYASYGTSLESLLDEWLLLYTKRNTALYMSQPEKAESLFQKMQEIEEKILAKKNGKEELEKMKNYVRKKV